MAKTSGGVRNAKKGGGLGGDKSGNFKSTDISNPESISKIQNSALRLEIQQGISKYESRLGVRQRNVQLADFEGAVGVHVTVNGKSGGVYLNKAYFKNKTIKDVVKMKRDAYASKFLTKTNKPVQHTVVHELGHATWNSHLDSRSAKAATREIKQAYAKFLSGYKSGKLKGYGRYATSNINEFFAETVTKAVLGSSDSNTRRVKSIIKKYKL